MQNLPPLKMIDLWHYLIFLFKFFEIIIVKLKKIVGFNFYTFFG
jgi:hypothetical protein